MSKKKRVDTEIVSVDALTPDHNNANEGTERGRRMLETSLEKLGAGRSIVLDKNRRVIAGNKTLEVAHDIGLDEIVVVRTNGRQLVAVQRDDLDLADDEGEARQLAYADNRVGQTSLKFAPDVIKADLKRDVNLDDWFTGIELSGIDSRLIERDAEPIEIDETYAIVIELESEQKQLETLEKLSEMGLSCRALIL